MGRGRGRQPRKGASRGIQQAGGSRPGLPCRRRPRSTWAGPGSRGGCRGRRAVDGAALTSWRCGGFLRRFRERHSTSNLTEPFGISEYFLSCRYLYFQEHFYILTDLCPKFVFPQHNLADKFSLYQWLPTGQEYRRLLFYFLIQLHTRGTERHRCSLCGLPRGCDVTMRRQPSLAQTLPDTSIFLNRDPDDIKY